MKKPHFNGNEFNYRLPEEITGIKNFKKTFKKF